MVVTARPSISEVIRKHKTAPIQDGKHRGDHTIENRLSDEHDGNQIQRSRKYKRDAQRRIAQKKEAVRNACSKNARIAKLKAAAHGLHARAASAANISWRLTTAMSKIVKRRYHPGP
jgi:predicted metal-dependent peptidase